MLFQDGKCPGKCVFCNVQHKNDISLEGNIGARVRSSPWQHSGKMNDRKCQNLDMETGKEYPTAPELSDSGILKCNLQRGGDLRQTEKEFMTE